jgi:hypothetical protein
MKLINQLEILKLKFSDDPELSNDLRYATITTISNLECRMVYGDQVTDNMVCVIGNYNEGTCTVCCLIF